MNTNSLEIPSFSGPDPQRSAHLVLDQIQFSHDGQPLTDAGPGMVSFCESRAGDVLTEGTIIGLDGRYQGPVDPKQLRHMLVPIAIET